MVVVDNASVNCTYHAQVMSLAAELDEGTVIFLVGNVEQLVECESVLPTHCDVWLYVVELAEQC